MHKAKTTHEKMIELFIKKAKEICDVQRDNYNQIIIYTSAYLDKDGSIIFKDEDEDEIDG